jgi:hypothetical protein
LEWDWFSGVCLGRVLRGRGLLGDRSDALWRMLEALEGQSSVAAPGEGAEERAGEMGHSGGDGGLKLMS